MDFLTPEERLKEIVALLAKAVVKKSTSKYLSNRQAQESRKVKQGESVKTLPTNYKGRAKTSSKVVCSTLGKGRNKGTKSEFKIYRRVKSEGE